jgi:hypothetical protein
MTKPRFQDLACPRCGHRSDFHMPAAPRSKATTIGTARRAALASPADLKPELRISPRRNRKLSIPPSTNELGVRHEQAQTL